MAGQSIAFVANTSWSIYKFRLYLIGKLIKAGYIVYVLAPRDNYTTQFEHLAGLTFVELGHYKPKSISPIRDILLYKELLRHYRALRPDLIFHYTIKANVFGALAAGRAGIPAICVVTGLGYTFIGKGWLRTAARLLYKYAFRRAREIWFLNEDDRRLFIEERLVDPARTFVLPGEGVDTGIFFAAPPAPDPARVTFLMIGRITRHKGIYEFMNAAESLKRQGLNVACQLLGPFDDNNPAAVPRHEVEEWVSRNILTYLGHTDNVIPFMSRADCIVLPSYREGMPLSLLEGASMCRALIAADTPGCRTLVEEGINGFICRAGDGADLAKKMSAYYHLPPTARQQMGIAARNKVLQGFTSEHIAAIYLEKINALGAKS